MKRLLKMRTPDQTWPSLGQGEYYRPFIEGYTKILKANLKQIKHYGNNNCSYSYYTCGETHDERNPNWKPFKFLWNYSERDRYDFFVARDIIFEWFGRKLVCECEVLSDDEKRWRMELERMF